MSYFPPNTYVITQCLRGIDPSLPFEARLDAIEAASARDAASTIGCLAGLLGGILDAIEARTHGMVTAQEIADEVTQGILCRLQQDQEGTA